MVISTNNKGTLNSFTELLHKTNKYLNDDALEKSDYYLSQTGTKLEQVVFDALTLNAGDTEFEDSFKIISGQRFPDIISNDYFGIEVKSSKTNSWNTLGNSLFESTRVDGIERIFVVYGKLVEPIEFRTKPYEDCLSEVKVTHSPRYQIDMDIAPEETILHRLNLKYDEVRKLDNPFLPFSNYYQKNLKEGETLWWLSERLDDSAPLTLRTFNVITPIEKNELRNMGFVLFPEIFSNNHQTKYSRFSLWLVKKHSVVNNSVRDTFSAGGQRNIKVKNKMFLNVPRIFQHLFDSRTSIIDRLMTIDDAELSYGWGAENLVANEYRGEKWIEQIIKHCKKTEFDAASFLMKVFENII